MKTRKRMGEKTKGLFTFITRSSEKKSVSERLNVSESNLDASENENEKNAECVNPKAKQFSLAYKR